MTKEAPGWLKGFTGLLAGTACRVAEGDGERVVGSIHKVRVSCLSHSLRETLVEVAIAQNPMTRRWSVAEPRDFLREQRLRYARHDAEAADRGTMVEKVFADRLRAVANRSVARRALFALSQCEETKTTQWEDVSHTAMRDGVAYATLSMGRGVSWRMGELRIREKQLPQTILADLQGRPVTSVLDLPGLGDLTIQAARSGAEGIVLRCAVATEPYWRVWRDLGGE